MPIVDSLPDVLRLANAIIAILSLIGMTMLYHWWASRPRAERFLLLALMALVAVTGYGSLEALIMDVPPGARVVFYTPALLYCLYGIVGLYRKIRKYRKEEENRK